VKPRITGRRRALPTRSPIARSRQPELGSSREYPEQSYGTEEGYDHSTLARSIR
jgi:hypothetical protein